MVWRLLRQLVYTMVICNNRLSFHLWWKENFVKHRKVSKYYETYCRINCFWKRINIYQYRNRVMRVLNYVPFDPTCSYFSRTYVPASLRAYIYFYYLSVLNYLVSTCAHFLRTYVPTTTPKWHIYISWCKAWWKLMF